MTTLLKGPQAEQRDALYAQLGRIVVESEHLNSAMGIICYEILVAKGLPDEYAEMLLAGMKLENTRRLWVPLTKLFYDGNKRALEVIDHFSTRIDNVTKRRNDVVHRVWIVSSAESTTSYAAAHGYKRLRELPSKKNRGGYRILKRDARDFQEIFRELRALVTCLHIFMGCVITNGTIEAKFRSDADGKLSWW